MQTPPCFCCFGSGTAARATVRCHSCSPGGIYLCDACDAHLHSESSQIHDVDLLHPEGIFVPRAVSRRTWTIATCSACNSPVGDTAEVQSTNLISVTTAICGVVEVVVKSVRCQCCLEIVGDKPEDFFCVSGAGGGPMGSADSWFPQDVLRIHRALFKSSKYNLSAQARIVAQESEHTRREGGTNISTGWRRAFLRRIR